MANVYQVYIRGWVSYDCTPFDEWQRSEVMTKALVSFVLPYYGFQIEFEKEHDKSLPNLHGGQTTFLPYTIKGQEAIWTDQLVKMVDAFQDCGWVQTAQALPMDDKDARWFTLFEHQPSPHPIRNLLSEFKLQ